MKCALWRWIRRGKRPSAESVAAGHSANQSQARAERDWMAAVARRAEAADVTQSLRAHNTANRYDDWLREIVRR